MTTKEAVDNDCKKWKDVVAQLDSLFALSATPGNGAKIKAGIIALNEEISRYLPFLQERIVLEFNLMLYNQGKGDKHDD